MNYVSSLPLSAAERSEQQEQDRARRERSVTRRKACPSGQDYNRPPTKQEKAALARLMGEAQDT